MQRYSRDPNAADLPRFRVEIQHEGLVIAKRVGNWLSLVLVLTPCVAMSTWGMWLPGSGDHDSALYVGAAVVAFGLSIILGFVLAGCASGLVLRLYLRLSRHEEACRENVAVFVDEDGIHIEGLGSLAWLGLNHSDLPHLSEYSGHDITLSSPGRLPVLIESYDHINKLAFDIDDGLTRFRKRHPNATPADLDAEADLEPVAPSPSPPTWGL